MIKRINFTERKRIRKTLIDIEVYDGTPRKFDARIDLAETGLPEAAAVYLEATCAGSNAVQRFDFGSVSEVRSTEPCVLSELEGKNVYFTLKIVDTTERFGRILGLAENIRPQRAGTQTATGRRGILPIEEVDLKQDLWKLEFREHDVFLLVNQNVTGLVDRVSADPAFYSIIYPSLVRQILYRAIGESVDPDEEADRWPVMWLRFARKLNPVQHDIPTTEDAIEDIDTWVDSIVENFCEEHELRDKFVRTAGDDGDLES